MKETASSKTKYIDLEKIKKTNIKEIQTLITANFVLFFDLDGTLVDSNYANFLSYKKAIHLVLGDGFDLTFSPDLRFNRTCLNQVIPNLSAAVYDRIIEEKEKLFPSYLHKVKLNKNIVEILEKFSTRNKTVLVTNCRKNRALLILNHFKLYNKFDNVFYKTKTDTVENGNKYQTVIDILNISPRLIIVFENEGAEIINAIKAGIPIGNILRR